MMKVVLHQLLYRVVLLLPLLLWLPDVAAVCEINTPLPSIDIAYSQLDAFEATSSDPYLIDGVATKLHVTGGFWRAGHEYLALDYDRENLTTPVTNGDLHTLFWAYRNTALDNDRQHLGWEILPTLAVSSNQLKNPDYIKGSSFRVDGHLFWQTMMTQGSGAVVGICVSTLTGEYEAIPLFAVNYQYADLALSLGYPATELNFTLSENIKLTMGWSLAGNQWEVLDKQLARRNDVELSSKQYHLILGIKLSSHNSIEISWVKHYDQAMEYLARNDARLSIEMDDARVITLGYIYQF